MREGSSAWRGRMAEGAWKRLADRRGEDERLIGQRARPRHCKHCGVAVLVGYDAPTMAGLAVVDPRVLDPMGEAAALVLGRTTYRLWGSVGTYELDFRAHVDVRPSVVLPRAGGLVAVVASHVCGSRLPGVDIPLKRPAAAVAAGDPPY